MKVNLQKMISSLSYSDELDDLDSFNQFNISGSLIFRKIICKPIYIKNRKYIIKTLAEICKVEPTYPDMNILSTKIIGTIEGTSLEGQHLTGKKLIIVGELNLNLIITYDIGCKKFKRDIRNITIPFNTFIVIAKDTDELANINLKYLIEDVTAILISEERILVSISLLMQYLDKC
ncbi:MAG: hypothetical protein RR620_00675 [Clostridium sp.]